MHPDRINNTPIQLNGPNHEGYNILVNRYHVTRIIAEDNESMTFELQHIYRPECIREIRMLRDRALMRWSELYLSISDVDTVETVVKNILAQQKPYSDPSYGSHFFYLAEIDDILVIPYAMFQFLDNP